MLKLAFKRVLVLLPAVWLIASVVFLLSKAVPGQANELEFELAAQNANSRAKSEAYQRAYQQMLHRTGQDLPLFYFRIGRASEPDTLFRITSEADRTFLKALLNQTGNWPAVASFHQKFQDLNLKARQFGNPELQKAVVQVKHQMVPGKRKVQIEQLELAGQRTNNPMLIQAAQEVKLTFETLSQTATPNRNYVPKLFWYGTENQYHRWFRNLLQGNLGISNRDARPVTEIIAEALSVTWWLALAAFALVTLLAPEIAMVLSRKSAKPWRNSFLNLLYALESVPLFVLALLVLALSSYAGWLYDFPEEVSQVLVVFCLVLVNLPYLTGHTYASMQTALQENYVLTARAKGCSDKKVLRKHVLRNSLLPIITLLSDFFPALLAGTVVLEVIFSVPGMGRLLVNSVLTRDYEVITGIVLLVGLLKMLAHLLADVLYAAADPRIKR